MALAAVWGIVYTGRWDPPLKSPGREVVRDGKAVAVGPERREWMGEWGENSPWDGGLFEESRRGQIWGGPQLFALGLHVMLVPV